MKTFFKIFFTCFFLYLSIAFAFAGEKVEDVFIDIDKNFENLESLQYLYDQGFIQENDFRTYAPNKSITREEFLAILLETNCQKCVKPETNIDILSTYYRKNVYYDVSKGSDYFYCIAYADDKKYIQGYDPNTKCDNGETSNQAPFCPYNPIKYEEALAIIMRTSGILSQNKADEIITNITNGVEYPNIGKNIKPILPNGEPYSFYPYFYTALNYSITDIGSNGNIEEYSLLPGEEFYFPESQVTKNQMLPLALFAHKNSECQVDSYTIGGEINLKDGSCNANESCELQPNFTVASNIDFEGLFSQTQIIDTPDENYTWVIHNLDDNTESIYKGKYLDNISFNKEGNYRADLYIIDVLGNKGKYSQNFEIYGNNNVIFDGFISSNLSDENNSFIANINGNNGPYRYNWDFGDGNYSDEQNPNHSYQNPGIYDVVLEVTDSDGNTSNFYTKANKDQDVSSGVVGVEVIFIGENNIADFEANNIDGDSFYWDFGDGNYSDEQNPNHSYQNPGIYDVILIVDSQIGTSTYNLQVNIPENQDNLYAQISAQKNVTQDNSYTFNSDISGGEGPFTYLWDFGDGNTSTLENPTHIYQQTGINRVKLTVTDSQGDSAIGNYNIYIDTNPNSLLPLVFTTSDPNTLDFAPIQYGYEGPFEYIWEFGDGNSSTQSNPTHTYSQPGEYNVELKLNHANGTKVVNLVVIIPQGNNNFDADVSLGYSIPDQNTYNFESNIVSGEGLFEYIWDFGDGKSSTQPNPTHTFQGEGPFQINVVIIDKNGEKIIKNFILYPNYSDLNINLNLSNGEQDNEYNFESIILKGEGPFEYLWDFGDGNSSDQQNPNHIFLYNGNYDTSLTITDSFGNQKTVITNIYVSSAQQDLFNIDLFAQPYEGNAPLLVDFDSQVLGDDSLEYKYLWDFGDGDTSQSPKTSHSFYQPGSYLVSLKVTHPSGKIIQKTITITVLNGNQIIIEDEIGNQTDTDGDSVIDINDRCIDLPGDSRNQGCPIFDIPCQVDSDCPSSSKCGTSSAGNNICIAVEKEVTCNLFSQGIIQGNVVCDTCPCQNTINFKAQLRACDVIFPAIVSPDGSEIYSKGSYFQIK